MRQLANLLPRITIRNETPPTIKAGGNLPTRAERTMTKQTPALRSYLNRTSPAQSHGDSGFRYSQLADRFTNDPPSHAVLTNTELQTRGNAAIKMENSQRARRVPQGRLTLAVGTVGNTRVSPPNASHAKERDGCGSSYFGINYWLTISSQTASRRLKAKSKHN